MLYILKYIFSFPRRTRCLGSDVLFENQFQVENSQIKDIGTNDISEAT